MNDADRKAGTVGSGSMLRAAQLSGAALLREEACKASDQYFGVRRPHAWRVWHGDTRSDLGRESTGAAFF